MTESLDYYRHRQEQERALAFNAQTEMARNIHINLADRYHRLVHDETEPVVEQPAMIVR